MEGATVFAIAAPSHYRALLAPVPPEVTFVSRMSNEVDLVHVFEGIEGEIWSGLKLVVRKELR